MSHTFSFSFSLPPSLPHLPPFSLPPIFLSVPFCLALCFSVLGIKYPQAAPQTERLFYCLFKLNTTESDALTLVTQIDTESATWN